MNVQTANKARPDTSEAELLRIQQAVAASGDIAYEWDLEADQVRWTGEVASLANCGIRATSGPGADFLRRLDAEDVIDRRRRLHAHVTSHEPFDCEYQVLCDNGKHIWINERGSVEREADGRPARLVGTMRVITERKETEARLIYEAAHDTKTGLFNRAKVTDVLDDVIQHNRSFDNRGIYVTVGIDRFSIINDAFGHETGDTVIEEVVRRLHSRPAVADVIGRVGGDVFGLIVAQCPEEQVVDLLNRILDEIRTTPIETPAGPIHVTASIGCASFPGADEAAHEVMAKADLALRQAKNSGRNTFSRYEESRDKAAADRELMAVADRVKRALTNDQLLLAYQPIVKSDSHEVAHYECLLRMIDEDGRISSAGAFMPAIEEMGLVTQIDLLVLELATKQLLDNKHLHLALNVSGMTTGSERWLNRMVKIARDYPELPPRMLVEITETAILGDIDEAANFVSALRELGCNVALDDFGAGYTTFRNLRVLPINVVKIDGSFVRKVAMERDNQIFVEALVTLAHGFELETVAECVETSHDASVLTAFGVDFLQGYYFGKPKTGQPWLEEEAKSGTD